MAPISLPLVVEAIARVARGKQAGIFQLSGDRDISYAEIGLRLAEHLSVDTKLVQPIYAAEAGKLLETIPAFTSLDVHAGLGGLGLQLPGTQSIIDWAFRNIE